MSDAGTEPLALPAPLRQEILAHCRSVLPEEGCGLLVGDGTATRFVPVENLLHAPDRFELEPAALVAALVAADDRGEAIEAIVHSHPRSPARPSESDLAGSAGYPEALHLVAGPFDGAATTELRAWRVGPEGSLEEVALGS